MGSPSATHTRGLLVIVVIAAAIVALTVATNPPPRLSPPAERGAFDTARAMESLREFVGDGTPRSVGSAGHDAARTRLLAMLATIDCQVSEQPFHARGWDRTAVAMTNVIARTRAKGPSSNDAGMVLLCAHYDSVAAGPGAGDNAAGVACAIEVLRDLAEQPAATDVLVLFADGEETGLNGARAFVLDYPLFPRIASVVNLDARGSDGPVYAFETGSDGAWHASLLARLDHNARTTSLAAEAYRQMPNGTDFSVFLRAGLPGFNLAFIGSPRNYHRASDTIDNLDPRTVGQMGTTALSLVRALSETPPPRSAAPRAHVWFDLFGWTILHWPAWANWAIVGGSAATFVGVLRIRRRRVGATILGSALAAVATLGILAIAVLAGTLATMLLRISGAVELPWPSAGVWWGECAIWALGFLIAAIAVQWLARRRMRRREHALVAWDSFLGSWFAILSIGALVAAEAPGAAHPFVVPVAVAAIAAVVAVRLGSRRPVWCTVAGASATLLVWIPLEPAFVDAFGLSLGGFTALRGALVAATLAGLVGEK
ncbi:MAG: M20/M25/M40 family metallo-hydrolase [Phycisphaerales bacterium]|nr:M20/M25/M40 family metallo-hydrolase [Phycisphaerales bacterium]